MRVTPAMLNAQVLSDLQQALATLGRKQDHLSSGRRILAPADDPGGMAQTLAIRSRQAATEQFQKNVAGTRGALESTEGVLQAIAETVTQAKDTALLGANDIVGPEARKSFATQVNQLLENLVELANSRESGGSFLFGGQESTVAPYSVTRDSNGAITAVSVNSRGIDGQTLAEVSEGVTLATTVSGTSVFGSSTDTTYAFNVLIRLRDALNANSGAGVRTALDELTSVLDRATVSTTVVGARLGWLGLLEERLTRESVGQTSTLSGIEDLDIAKAMLEFQQQQTVYEAALASGARLLRVSLLDFLR